jgi:MmyB-like transcription regulator ligand binding domain
VGRSQRALPPHRRQTPPPPVVGDLELTYEGLDLPADPGWHLFTFTAAPGSPSDDRLRLLASWAATLEHENTASPSAGADTSPNSQ